MVKETKAELEEEIVEEKKNEGQWNTIIAIVLAIVLVVAFFQAIQINSMDSTVAVHEKQITAFSTGNVALQPSAQTTPITTTSSVPASLQNIPDMVGGC